MYMYYIYCILYTSEPLLAPKLFTFRIFALIKIHRVILL